MVNKTDKEDLDFDFSGKKELKKHYEQQNARAAKFDNFKKMGKNFLAIGSVAAIVGGGGAFAYHVHEQNIDNEIQSATQTIQSTGKGAVLGLMERENNVAQQTFARNQMLINRYGEYSELVEALNLNRDLAVKNSQNTRLYKETTDSLTNDKAAVLRVYDVINKTRDEKINELLNSNDLPKFKDWSNNVKNNQFMYVGGLQDLNHDLDKQLQTLESTKQEIIQNVQERLKNKDYNLDAAQSNFSNQIVTDSASQIQDLKEAKEEIKDAQLARQDNNESPDNNMNQLLTDSDIQDATDATSQIQTAAMDQVKDDRSKVDALIAAASVQPNNQNGVANANTASQNNNNPQVVNNYYGSSSPHLSFFDYYLMYNWMNSGSTNTYHTTYVNNNQPTTGAYKTPIPVSTRSSLYDVKNANSYVNKTLMQSPNSTIKGSTFQSINRAQVTRPNITALRAKIDVAKSQATQARSWRSAEFSRMGINSGNSSVRGGGYKGGTYRSSSTHMSAVSEGGLGHGGSAHSSGFGG